MKRIKLFFKWFDFWIGFYVDTKNKKLYICPLPMFGMMIDYQSNCLIHIVDWLISKYIKVIKRIGKD